VGVPQDLTLFFWSLRLSPGLSLILLHLMLQQRVQHGMFMLHPMLRGKRLIHQEFAIPIGGNPPDAPVDSLGPKSGAALQPGRATNRRFGRMESPC
jgi:hypothetical protein